MARYLPGDPDRDAFSEGGLEDPIITQGSSDSIDWLNVDPNVQIEMDRLRGEFRQRDDLWLVDSEAWREGLENRGYAFVARPQSPIGDIGDIPEPDFSIIDQIRDRYRSAEPLVVNDRGAAQEAKKVAMFTSESVKEGIGTVKAGAKRTAENLSTNLSEFKNLHEGIGQKIDWIKAHKAVATGALVAYGLMRHHHKKQLSNLDRQSATISRGNQHRPAGSAAGMNAAPSAYIQMNNTGYDNSQGARYGTTLKPTLRPPPMSRPTGYGSSSGSVADYRRATPVTQDQQLANMI